MIGYVILGLVLGLPLLLGILLRVNVSYLFFALMAGELLARYFGDDAEVVMGLVTKDEVVLRYAEVVVLLLPIVLTALVLKHTISHGKLFVQLIPMVVTGVVLAAFLLPMLPDGLQTEVRSTQIGGQLLKDSDFIIGAVVMLQIVSLWLLQRSKEGHGKKKH